MEWTADQSRALEALSSSNNVFITGGSGTGKSTLVRHFVQDLNAQGKEIAVLASTGTAAILLGGRTFHSFFGLGILEGGPDLTFDRATRHKGIVRRLKKTEVVLIDEISMIGAEEFQVAERIARKARANSAPWGGLQIVVVGDFSQLPPVMKRSPESNFFDQSPEENQRPWCFLTETWKDSEFEFVYMDEIVRSKDSDWNHILNEIRWARISKEAQSVLQSRVTPVGIEFQGTRLFARRAQVERLNHERLSMLDGEVREFNTIYMGQARKVDELKRNAPIPETLLLKKGALVMFRQNDPEYRWVNGTLGTVREFNSKGVRVELLNGKSYDIKPSPFNVLDAEGESVASASNYPLNLAWATTIHKAQGATLDRAHVDLRGVWEHGQSYVALSRVRSIQDLTIEGLGPRVFRVDEAVRDFYRNYIEE